MEPVLYKVAIHYDLDCGRIEYNPATHQINVILDNAVKKLLVEEYLKSEQLMPVADGDDLVTFHSKKLNAAESVESFKLVLTRMWQKTGVYVDWSRPVV